MIAIINDGSKPEPTGEHHYILRINQKEIARFRHRREDGLAACLSRAAAAAAQAEYAQQSRIAMALSRDAGEGCS